MCVLSSLAHAEKFICNSEKGTSRIICHGQVILPVAYVYAFQRSHYQLRVTPDEILESYIPDSFDIDEPNEPYDPEIYSKRSIYNHIYRTGEDWENMKYFYIKEYSPSLFKSVQDFKKEFPDLARFKIDSKKWNKKLCLVQGNAMIELKSFYLYNDSDYKDANHLLDYRVLHVGKPFQNTRCTKDDKKEYEQLLNAPPPNSN